MDSSNEPVKQVGLVSENLFGVFKIFLPYERLSGLVMSPEILSGNFESKNFWIWGVLFCKHIKRWDAQYFSFYRI